MAEYGYVRVSSRDQNEARQMIALREAGVPDGNIYLDKQSGKDFDRPAWKRLKRKLKKGDVVFIKSLVLAVRWGVHERRCVAAGDIGKAIQRICRRTKGRCSP